MRGNKIGASDLGERLSITSKINRRQLLGLLSSGAILSISSGCSLDFNSALPGMDEEPLYYASLIDIANLIEAQELSPVDLTEKMLSRIDLLDGTLNSYATVIGEQAMEAAHVAEGEIQSGNYRGKLHGIPIAIKDLFYTKGVRTMGGLSLLADFVPTYDATVVAKLKNAGSILLGKLNMSEGAMPGYHPEFEVPVNPWDQTLWPGSSSSGSGVATAAGLCFASLGSDTGGSITFPAMSNGIVGVKPTYGRVSRYGVLPLAQSLDHVGPMSRYVADAAIVLEVISGFDPNDSTSLNEPIPKILDQLSLGVRSLRIGFDPVYSSGGVDAGLYTAIESAVSELEGLGAQIVKVEMPEFTEDLVTAWFTICSYEAYTAHAANYPIHADNYGLYYRDFLEEGSRVTADEYYDAGRLRSEFNTKFRAVLSEVDAVVSPAGGIPFPISREILYGDMEGFDAVLPKIQFQFTAPANFAGTPIISLPCGVNDEGLPYTMQLLGRHLSEAMLFRIAYAYEEATEWNKRHPAV